MKPGEKKKDDDEDGGADKTRVQHDWANYNKESNITAKMYFHSGKCKVFNK